MSQLPDTTAQEREAERALDAFLAGLDHPVFVVTAAYGGEYSLAERFGGETGDEVDSSPTWTGGRARTASRSWRRVRAIWSGAS